MPRVVADRGEVLRAVGSAGPAHNEVVADAGPSVGTDVFLRDGRYVQVVVRTRVVDHEVVNVGQMPCSVSPARVPGQRGDDVQSAGQRGAVRALRTSQLLPVRVPGFAERHESHTAVSKLLQCEVLEVLARHPVLDDDVADGEPAHGHPVVLDESYIASIQAQMSPLPSALYRLFLSDYGLSDYDTALLTEEKPVALYFMELCRHTPHFKAAANLVINKILPWRDEARLPVEQFPVAQAALAEMIDMTATGKLSNTVAYQRLLPAMMEEPARNPGELAQALNLLHTGDADFLIRIVDEVLAAHPDKVAQYRKGKKGLQGFFMGEIMRLSKGKADPKAVTPLLTQKLDAV